MPTKIIITGASGFIGMQIVPRLVSAGFELLLVGRNPDKLSALFPDIKNCSYASLAEDGRGFKLLLHLAVLNNNAPSKAGEFNAVNVTLLEQTLTPMWILNQDLFQKALNTQAELMTTANSEKVRSDAANSILTHLKQPETKKIELDIGVKKDSSIDILRQATLELAAEQRLQIQAGQSTVKEVAEGSLVIENEIDQDE